MTKVTINGEGYLFKYDIISYDDIVKFALGDKNKDANYKITYSDGLMDTKGTVKQGDVIPIIPDMIFNAVITGNG